MTSQPSKTVVVQGTRDKCYELDSRDVLVTKTRD